VNVLSLFDGISCGQVALERAGVKACNYYASEIDKYATQITQKNYPDTIQLGDVAEWRSWVLPEIDILIGGSPCQGFSFAGKQLAFDDPRSKLFFEFVNILKVVKPKYFLLENVKMKKEFQNIISEYLGVEAIEINSALVSAQNRKRLYWTNIPNVTHPEDKGIFLKDVTFDDTYFSYLRGRGNNPGGLRAIDGKIGTLTSHAWEHNNFVVGLHLSHACFGEGHRPIIEKSPTIRPASGGGHIPSLLLSKKAIEYMNREVKDGRTHWDFKHHSDTTNEKSAAVVANFFKGVPYNVLIDWDCIRKFHPIECERLQTLPDNYTEGISNTQRYKAIGNGWTVDVIAHILQQVKY
jgi:DNA-cytosine methyltransferase